MRRWCSHGIVVGLLALIACGDDEAIPATASIDAGTSNEADAAVDASGPVDPPDAGLPSATKLDVLFVVDNSFGMRVKHDLIANGIARFFGRVAVRDIHVGVIASSIDQGGDLCPRSRPDAYRNAHLQNRLSPFAETPTVAGAEQGFLSLGPGGSVADMATLVARSSDIVRGLGENGCSYDAPLEAMYRFVAQPDPPLTYALDAAKRAQPSGVDYPLLAERSAFFRSDSAIAIVLVTDDNDASFDPRSLGGFGYGFASIKFPRSQVPSIVFPAVTIAPRGASPCATDPTSAACTSCFFAASCDGSTPACVALRADPACTSSPVAGKSGDGFDGFLAPQDDTLNLRAFDMKRRFGVEARYPIGRYLTALTGGRVPDRTTEHPAVPSGLGDDYAQATTCRNPLFSVGLPKAAGDELCTLSEGTRDPRLVVVGVLTGAPPSLVSGAPDWTKLLGRGGFESNDVTGIDPHMLPSTSARPGLSGADLPRGDNGTDPIHGREWNTGGKDLEYACTFALPEPQDCRIAGAKSCECTAVVAGNFPVCGGSDNTTQVRGRAHPSIRPLMLARRLGAGALVGSVCDLDSAGSYGPFLERLGDEVAKRLR